MKSTNTIKSTKSELDKQIEKKEKEAKQIEKKEAKKRELKELPQVARIEERKQEKKPSALIQENNKFGYIIELIKDYKTIEELDTILKIKFRDNLELLNKFVVEEKLKM